MNELRITFAGQMYSFAPGQTVRIGRHPDNAVVVSDPIVSRDHAKVSWDSGTWTLDDLGKGRTFVGGLAVGSVNVQQPLEVHLATPLGPELRIEVAGGDGEQAPDPLTRDLTRVAGPTAAAVPTMAAGTALASPAAGSGPAPAPGPAAGSAAASTSAAAGSAAAGSAAAAAAGSAAAAAAGSVAAAAAPAADGATSARRAGHGDAGLRHIGPVPSAWDRQRGSGVRGYSGSFADSGRFATYPPTADSAPHARPDTPGGEFATAVHILVPVRSWLKDPGWKQGSRLLVIAYGLLPSLFVVLLSSSTDTGAPGWAYSLAIAPLWAVAFWLLIRPGHITKLIAWLGLWIIAAVMALLPIMTIPWETRLHSPANQHNLLAWIYGVGFAEEVTKALPVLIAALALRWIWKTTLDVRVWMFLGTISGLTFGVIESARYTRLAVMTSSHDTIALILTFALRVFVDGFQHAVWAGISAFFIGMGVNYRRRRIPLILFGITLPAVLHGLNDWATLLASLWLWIAVEALSMLLFIGYTMSAATIERQVRDTPLFRGESMIMDRAAYREDRGKP